MIVHLDRFLGSSVRVPSAAGVLAGVPSGQVELKPAGWVLLDSCDFGKQVQYKNFPYKKPLLTVLYDSEPLGLDSREPFRPTIQTDRLVKKAGDVLMIFGLAANKTGMLATFELS